MKRSPAAQRPPADGQAEVRLADDSRMTIRPIEPGDKSLLAYLNELDQHDHKALLAIDLRSGCYAGVARFLRVAEEVADPAMVLVDRWPRFGLGTASRKQAERARAEGITRFSETVLAENRDAIRLLERLGAATRGELGRELRHVVLPDTGGAGPTLCELLRAAAAGLLAPARALMQRVSPDNG